MMVRIILSLEAERDLDSLFDYIVAESGVARAETILRRIDDALGTLRTSPRIGRVRQELEGEPRSFAVRPWIILYDLLPDGRGIFVLRLLDGRRDLPQQIGG